MAKNVLRIFIAAVLLRVLVMPFLFHIDLKSLYFYATLLQDGVLNLYDYMHEFRMFLNYRQDFVYPPPIYFTQGTYYILIKPFLGSGFTTWINDWGVGNYTSDFLFRYLFILKIPYLILDVVVGWLLYKLVEEKFRIRALIIWFFNPLTLYINYGLANFDIFPTTLVLLSLFFYTKNKFFKSGLSLGIATAFKIFPLVLWPFFVISVFKTSGREKAIIFFGSVFITFAVLNLPWFYDLIPIYNSGLTNRALQLEIPYINFHLPVVYILLFSVLLFFIFKKKYDTLTLAKYIFCNLLILLSITTFHPQWWLWTLPFLTILCAYNLIYLLVFIPIIGLGALQIIGLNDQFITLGILNPLIPNINNSSFLFDFVFRFGSEKILFVSKNILIILSLILVILVNSKIRLQKIIANKFLFISFFSVTILSFVLFFSLGIVSSSLKVFVQGYENHKKYFQVYKPQSFSQTIPVKAENVHLVSINLKNTNAKNNDPFNILLETSEGEKREFNLTGGNIGDGVWVDLRINPLNIGQSLKVDLNSPTESTDSAILVPIDFENNFHYKIFRRNSPVVQLKETGNLFIQNLLKDKYFLSFYGILIAVLLGLLIKSYIKR